jgi:hypothetical protein
VVDYLAHVLGMCRYRKIEIGSMMFFHDLSGYSVYTYETIILMFSVPSYVFVLLCHNPGTERCFMKYLSPLDDWQIVKNNMVKN